jgi:hypothetical protein
MANRFIASAEVLAALILAGTVAAFGTPQQPATAATNEAAAKQWNPPRLRGGQPDLQGAWDLRTITPSERPAVFAGKPVLTDDEADEPERQKAEFEAADPKDRRHLVSGAAAFATNRNADPA